MSSWQRNVFAVATASFVGSTGFTLVMPFLPLYLQELGVRDLGEVAMWSGLSLGVTPGVTALLAPALRDPAKGDGARCNSTAPDSRRSSGTGTNLTQ